jgi:hypothetical protein
VQPEAPFPDAVVFLFENSHQALWAETVAQELSVPVEVVPAPTSQVASCGLALKVPETAANQLAKAFSDEGIAFTKGP